MKPYFAALLFGLVFLTVGLLILVGSWGAYVSDSGIQESGGRSMGHVTGKQVAKAADGDSDFYVDYSFAIADGRIVTASRGISKADWERVRVGQTIEIRYDRDNPNRNFPAGMGNTSLGVITFTSVLGIVLGIAGMLLSIAAIKWRRSTA